MRDVWELFLVSAVGRHCVLVEPRDIPLHRDSAIDPATGRRHHAKRPDLVLLLPGVARQLLDVQIIHPPSIARMADRHCLRIRDLRADNGPEGGPSYFVRRAERYKRSAYRRSWPDPLPTVIPLVATTTGRFGPAAEGLFRTLAQRHADSRRVANQQHLSHSSWSFWWRRRLSVELLVQSMRVLSRRLDCEGADRVVRAGSSAAWRLSHCQLADLRGGDASLGLDVGAAGAYVPPCGLGLRRGAP